MSAPTTPAVAAKIDLSQIKAVVFDTFGTVVDWRSGIAREAAPFIARHRLVIAPDAFADAWRRRYQPAMEPIRKGERAYVPLDVLHRENLDSLLAELAPSAHWDEPEIANLTRAWHRLDPWPDAVEGLTRLKRKYVIGPLSNGNIALLVNMAKRAGIPWDVILGADVSRAYKPHPQSYIATAAALGIEPGELMLVAAHNRDLAAARRCGLATGSCPARLSMGRARRPIWRRARIGRWSRRISCNWRSGSDVSGTDAATREQSPQPGVMIIR